MVKEGNEKVMITILITGLVLGVFAGACCYFIKGLFKIYQKILTDRGKI